MKYENQTEFARRIGTNLSVINSLIIKRGLPKAANGEICTEDALEWLRRKGRLNPDYAPAMSFE
jgi:hypothetical protein